MKKCISLYFGTSLVWRIIIGFVCGALIGGTLWFISHQAGRPIAEPALNIIAPFGTIFVHMLKMIVVPVIFFSLVVGAASLPINKFGRVGLKTMGWYLICSVFAAVVGVFIALLINPGSGTNPADWQDLAGGRAAEVIAQTTKPSTIDVVTGILFELFRNPFEALSAGNFLPIIVFALLFGLSISVLAHQQSAETDPKSLERLLSFFKATRDVMFKIVDWILEYSPIGVLALTIVNFGKYGPAIVGPYVSITLGVVMGIFVMVFVVYSILLVIFTRQNPIKVFRQIREAMLMAFITRSSAATLPVSIKVAHEKLKIKHELCSFSLPLGATINMDGVCVHLPMFAVLAANIFGIDLSTGTLVLLVMTTVLSSIGAGGVPGGSLMLLFIILETMGLSDNQVAIIVALALGINPILDMFETMNNVTGDLICTYTVAHNEKLTE